jgi:hypothetical protein
MTLAVMQHAKNVLNDIIMCYEKCQCRQCLRDRNEGCEFANGYFIPKENLMMIVCSICGNKGCLHAIDHRHECTDRNEPKLCQ